MQQGLTGWASPIVPFYLPPHAAVLLAWLALLPYSLAYMVWLLVGIGCLIGSALLLAPRRPLLWAAGSLLFLPTLLALVHGQTTPLMLLVAEPVWGGDAAAALLGLATLSLLYWTDLRVNSVSYRERGAAAGG